MDGVKRTGGADSASTALTSSYPDSQTTIVQVSETLLSQVAQRLGISEEMLRASNPHVDPQNVQPGQELKLPEGQKAAEIPTPADSINVSKSQAQSKLTEHNLGALAMQAQLKSQVLQFGPGPTGPGQVGQVTAPPVKTPIEQLQEAAFNNDLPKIESLVKSGVDVNALGPDGKTPLMHAAMAENKEAMRCLLTFKAKVDQPAKDGKTTALMISAYLGKEKSVGFLLDNKADINKADGDKNTPLIIAAREGHTEIVNTLLKRNADPNKINKFDRTALMEAVKNGDTDATVALAKAKGIDPDIPDANGKTALMQLIDRTAKGDRPDNVAARALIEASVKRNGGPSALDQPFKPGGTNAMMQAAEKGFKDIAVALAEAKADPDVLMDPVSKRTAMMELLTNMPSGQTLSAQEAKALVGASANPDLEDKNGRTAIMEAVEKGQTEMIIALAPVADVDKKDSITNRTALMQYILSPDPKNSAAAQALIDASANLDVRGPNDRTALMEAARTGEGEIVKMLLMKKTADPDLKDDKGMTPLMLAAENGSKWAVRFLLDRDWKDAGQGLLRTADPSQYYTALSIAEKALKAKMKNPDFTAYQKQQFEETIKLLKDAIANP